MLARVAVSRCKQGLSGAKNNFQKVLKKLQLPIDKCKFMIYNVHVIEIKRQPEGQEAIMEAKLIKIDRNGSKHYEGYVTCDRCGGDGVYKWGAVINGVSQYAGTCFKCGGAGKVFGTWIERTSEYEAKLAEKRAEKHAKLEQERAEREAERERKQKQLEADEAARKAISQWVGEVGNKIQIEVTFEHRADYEVPEFGGFGMTTKSAYMFRDLAGNKLVWHTTGSLERRDENGSCVDFERGEKLMIKGTVKKHGEYRGEKQTELQRVKLM